MTTNAQWNITSLLQLFQLHKQINIQGHSLTHTSSTHMLMDRIRNASLRCVRTHSEQQFTIGRHELTDIYGFEGWAYDSSRSSYIHQTEAVSTWNNAPHALTLVNWQDRWRENVWRKMLFQVVSAFFIVFSHCYTAIQHFWRGSPSPGALPRVQHYVTGHW